MREKRFFGLGIGLAVLAVAALVWAGTVNQSLYGLATPYWYGLSGRTVSTYYLSFPTLTANDEAVGKAAAQTLTNKTLTAPVISSISNTGTLTLPTSTDTLVGRATTDVLTNKTLTAPVISTISNTGTLTLPTSTDTLVGKATTDVLTNKTLTAPIINSGQLALEVSTPEEDGVIDATAQVFILGTGVDLTGFTPAAGKLYFFYCTDSTADATVTMSAGATWEGTNDTIAFTTDGSGVLVIGISATRVIVISTIDTVSYS